MKAERHACRVVGTKGRVTDQDIERKSPELMLGSFSERHAVVRMRNITDLTICFSGSELLQMSQNNLKKNKKIKSRVLEDAGKGKCAILAFLF